ncbi:unnamed protein product [Larinioides sclopetarius]|uniref:Uncharacterized protein n=1 Tax=Larinioides sclopetarius TaxID=280406 RepID=A0AAV2BKV4_9ARAC
MNLNAKQTTFTVPVFCKDQAADIRNIEDAANKALLNIHTLYNEIMTPKNNSDAYYEASVSDYSSDSASVSIGSKNGCHSVTAVPKPLPEELCNKCKKLVSLCSACHKHDLSNSFQNHRQHQIINKSFLQERSNSYPRVKPFRRNSSYHPEQKYCHRQEHPAQRNTLEERKESQHQEECARKKSCYSEEVRRNSQHPEEVRRNSHFSKEVRKNSQHLEEVRRNSHYPEQPRQNSHYSLHESKFSRSNSVQKEQNAGRDFCQEERKSSYYPESITGTNSEYDDYTFKSIKESKIQFHITVPKPFSLSAENIRRQLAKEEKISKLREEMDSQIEKELNVKFSPKPVPKHVHLPLYGEMVKMNEQRKKERREKCIEILNEKTKPFRLSVNSRTCVSKSKSTSNLQEDESKTFKAKPVPKNILSENISQKIKSKEEIRKLLIAQRAEEMLRKSTLPFSPKSIPRSHSLFNVSDSTSKSNINVTKEKIEAITKRLYSIKCQETIENWNNKVLQNDLWNVEMYCSKKNCLNESNNDSKLQKSALPFHNFPVRKTTTTFLREKRIRADIEMRKRREEKDESIRQEMVRRKKEILKNIWPRLKSAEQMHDIGKEIEEKVKSYRESQKNREREYGKELEDMMRRVSNQFLLIERQSKELKETVVDTNKSVNGLSEKEESSSEAESDSLKEVESSGSPESDSPTPSASEKSDSS